VLRIQCELLSVATLVGAKSLKLESFQTLGSRRFPVAFKQAHLVV